MARLVDNLVEYLIDQGVATKAGKDIFIGFLPESEHNAIMIDQTGGVEPDQYIPVSQPTVQVMVRATEYDDGFDKAQACYDAIHRLMDNTILASGGVDLMTAFALQEPTHIGQDESNRHIFSVNFVFRIRGND